MVIVALALHDHAFDAPCLTDAYSLLSKDVWGSNECMPIRWKKEKLKVPVLRRINGGTLSEDEAMLYSKLGYDMGRQSLESGHEKAWTPRFARRGAANAANGISEHSQATINVYTNANFARRRTGFGPRSDDAA